jgi:ankyrin repeat protein
MTNALLDAWEAAVYNDVRTLKRLVPAEVSPNASTYSPENPIHTLLMCAAAHGAVRCVKYLLTQKADVNKRNYMGFTALHWSAYHGRTECVPLLLRHRADLEAKTQDGRTALHVSASRGHLSYVSFILDRGADIRAVSSNGWSAVFFAIAADSRPVCEDVIARGADWQCPDVAGGTALELADARGCDWARNVLEHAAARRQARALAAEPSPLVPDRDSESADSQERRRRMHPT